MLEAQFQNKWLDPAQFKTLKEFHKAYSESFGRAMAYKEIADKLDKAKATYQEIKKKIDSPTKSYEL